MRADMVLFNSATATDVLTAHMQAVRVLEQLLREATAKGTFTVEPCPKRALRKGHGNCPPPQPGGRRALGCDRCPRAPFDAAKEMPLVHRVRAKSSPALTVQLADAG